MYHTGKRILAPLQQAQRDIHKEMAKKDIQLKTNVKEGKKVADDLLSLVKDIKDKGRELKYLKARKCLQRAKIRDK